jgi:hypothetical protein
MLDPSTLPGALQGPPVCFRHGRRCDAAAKLGVREIQHRTTAPAKHATHLLQNTHANSTPTMSSIIARSAFRAAPRVVRPTPAFRRWASAAAEGERQAGKDALKTGAKRDPELYVRCAHTHWDK